MDRNKILYKPEFSPLETHILGLLASAGKPITTYNIAKKLNIPRLTVKKHLIILMKKNAVTGKNYIGKDFKKGIYWWLKYAEKSHSKT